MYRATVQPQPGRTPSCLAVMPSSLPLASSFFQKKTDCSVRATGVVYVTWGFHVSLWWCLSAALLSVRAAFVLPLDFGDPCGLSRQRLGSGVGCGAIPAHAS